MEWFYFIKMEQQIHKKIELGPEYINAVLHCKSIAFNALPNPFLWKPCVPYNMVLDFYPDYKVCMIFYIGYRLNKSIWVLTSIKKLKKIE